MSNEAQADYRRQVLSVAARYVPASLGWLDFLGVLAAVEVTRRRGVSPVTPDEHAEIMAAVARDICAALPDEAQASDFTFGAFVSWVTEYLTIMDPARSPKDRREATIRELSGVVGRTLFGGHDRALGKVYKAVRASHPRDHAGDAGREDEAAVAKSEVVALLLSGGHLPWKAGQAPFEVDGTKLRDALRSDHELRQLEAEPFTGPAPLPTESPVDAAHAALAAQGVRDALDRVEGWCREQGVSHEAALAYLLGQYRQEKQSRRALAERYGVTAEAIRSAEPIVNDRLQGELRKIA